MSRKRIWVLRISFVLIFIMFVWVVIGNYKFNSKERKLDFSEKVFEPDGVRDDNVSVRLCPRGYDEGNLGAWDYKSTENENGNTISNRYYGVIYELTINNRTKDTVADWSAKIFMPQNVYLNSGWNGSFTVHQSVNKKEKVYLFSEGNFDREGLTLDYVADDTCLLVPLEEGDYFEYLPSEKSLELPIVPSDLKNNEISNKTIGFIIYTKTDVDNEFIRFSNGTISYKLYRSIFKEPLFYVVMFCLLIWIILLIACIVADITYKKAVREMEMKKSGIIAMSDIYSIIYMIDLKKNELVPMVADEESEKLRPKHLAAQEQLINMFENDCKDSYLEMACDLCDFKTIQERLEGKKTFAFEYESKMYGWCRIRIFAMDREENMPLEKILFAIQVINDEKHEMEENARRINEAEHESRSKSIFLANMSHEIRTPINTVIGFDTMILREAKDPTIKSYAKNINSAATMLLSLINGILDMSKLEADKMELVLGEYSFKQTMIEIVNMVKARAEFERLDFICEISPNISDLLYGDNVRLKQVITNLIINAAKYTDKGSVKLSVFGKSHDGMMHLLISVKDTGIGIKEEDLKKISQRFTRFDAKRNHTVEGTGIGLNLVTGILRLMDSELHIVSRYGEGSEFYFEIEQKIVDEKVIGPMDFSEKILDDDEYQALFTAPEAKVLVVDDNVMNLKVFVDLLVETKLQIDTASSGTVALEKAKEAIYDLIFMDHMMPEMDGIETFRKLRADKNGKNAKTPIIVLTANAIKGAQEEYKEIGFDDFLSKPIQPHLLEQMVIKYLEPSKVNKNKVAKRKAKEKDVTVPMIFGVDTAYGLAHTGGLQSYMTLLNQFCAVADNDLVEIKMHINAIEKNHEDQEALNQFRIKIHSMKSSANIMGALQIYGLAATLEELAVKGDVDGICFMVSYFNEAWNSLCQSVKESLHWEEDSPCEAEKKELPDKEKLDTLLHLLETSMKSYDIKSADEMLSKLKEFRWDEKRLILMQELETAVANLDAENALDVCKKLSVQK